MALRLMCITAHPDDECGAFGGALWLAHQRGVETSVICLTEGRAASHRGNAQTGEELGQLRRHEFLQSLRVLGVGFGEVLTYPDGELVQQNFGAVTEVLVERIRRLKPHVIMTFGGDGNVNLHPDHTMVSCFATAAFHWAGREKFAPHQIEQGLLPYRPQKLYYGAAPFLAYVTGPETKQISLMPASLTLDCRQAQPKKLEAFLQHLTQAPLFGKVRAVFEATGGEERYLLAATRGMPKSPMETDMFAGVGEGE